MTASLVNHLWQSTLVAGLAWLVTLALRRDRAGVRYRVWLAASLKFLIPFSMFTAVGERFGVRPVVVASFVPYEVMVDTTGGPMPLQAVRFSAGQPAAVSLWHRIGAMLPDALLTLWAAGAVVLLAVWLVRWLRVASIVRASRPLVSGRVHDVLRRLEAGAGVRRPIRLVESAGPLEPGVFGLFAPTLVWPSHIDAHLSAEQIDAIIAHEVMHVRRRDNLAAAAHMAVQAAFWFHPFVWWLGARLIDERERACDEAVLGAGREPHAYAESILKTCQLLVESPLPCVSGVTGSELKKRIEHIMTNEIRPGLNAWKKCLLAAAGSAAVAVPFAVGVMTVAPVQARQAGGESAVRADTAPAFELIQAHRLLLEERLKVAETYKRLVGQTAAPAPALAATSPAFDVTSIKVNNTDPVGVGGLGWGPDSIRGRNQSPVSLIRMAFGVQTDQIVDAPAWADTERFNISAKVAPGVIFNAMTMLQPMLRHLLEDRFRLKIHHETKELNVYRLVRLRADRLGPRLAAGAPDACMPPTQTDVASLRAAARGCSAGPVPGGIGVHGMPISTLTSLMAPSVERVIVDATGLAGNWDLDLAFVNQVQDANGDGPSLFTALEEQLGLKLESGRAPVDVIVIDHLERPNED